MVAGLEINRVLPVHRLRFYMIVRLMQRRLGLPGFMRAGRARPLHAYDFTTTKPAKFRHTRQSGYPDNSAEKTNLDSRVRGNDESRRRASNVIECMLRIRSLTVKQLDC